MSVLITGGSGYLGRALIERLLADRWERICIYSRGEHAQAKLREDLGDDPRLRWFIGDVRDPERLMRAMSSVRWVIHAAALKRIEVGAYNPDEMVKTNVNGTSNVIEAARWTNVERVMFVSSDKAYQPVSPYGQTKALAESLVLNSNNAPIPPAFAVVRYGNVAGSTGSVIPTWRRAIAKGEKIKITDPDCTRFWMTRKQAADLVVDSLERMRGGETVVPSLPAFRLGDLAQAMGQRFTITTGLPPHEKKHESMSEHACSETARRATVEELRQWLTEIPE